MPLPEELLAEFTDAYWRSFRWQRTNWLGHPVAKSPTDLLAYQELIVDARPDWVIETPSDGGGRALFLASICELVGHGQVLSIGERPADELPRHPRLTYLTGDPLDDETVAAGARDGRASRRTRSSSSASPGATGCCSAFDLYSPLVPAGSGVVFEDTITGLPVWPAMGPGPAEAVREILRDHSASPATRGWGSSPRRSTPAAICAGSRRNRPASTRIPACTSPQGGGDIERR